MADPPSFSAPVQGAAGGGVTARRLGPAQRIAAGLGRPLLLMAGLLSAGWVLRSLHGHDLAAAARALNPIAFIALATAACAVGLPRQAVAFAAGYAHGAVWGTLAALLAQLAACTLNLAWARLIARRWVRARLGPRLGRLTRPLATHPFTAALTLRLLPVGSNLVLNLAAGALGVPTAAFLAGSAVGYLPQTLVFALLGAGVHLARGMELGLGAATFAGAAGLGVWLQRRDR